MRIAVLIDPKFPISKSFAADVRAAASVISKQIEFLYASTGRDIDMVSANFAQKPVDAPLVVPARCSATAEYNSLRWRRLVSRSRNFSLARRRGDRVDEGARQSWRDQPVQIRSR